MSSSFDDSWFQAAGSVCDFAGGDLFEHQQQIVLQHGRIDLPTGQLHPRGQHILAGAREADLAGAFVMQQRGCRRSRANEILAENRCPHFAANHGRRLAAQVTQIQIRLDTSGIQL